MIGDEESEGDEKDQRPFMSEDESDDSRVYLIFFSWGEETGEDLHEGEVMNIKRDVDGQPVQ